MSHQHPVRWLVRVTTFALKVCRGLHAAAGPPPTLSRPRVFTVLDFNQVHMLLACIQLVRLSHAVSCRDPLWAWGNQYGIRTAGGDSRSRWESTRKE
eukprot:1143695-Pelagomonas_calceolata.AAC.1